MPWLARHGGATQNPRIMRLSPRSASPGVPRIFPAAARVARRLIEWFRTSQRDLPWRRTRDPYAIWISEVMLQQTQVQTVIPYWERWMREVPDVAALARLPLERGLGLWEGLGYYRRLRLLIRAGQALMEQRGGVFPTDFESVLALPGIGRYTAGAICSIAFDQPAAIVDGNVARVLARVLCIDAPLASRESQAALWRVSEQIVAEAASTSELGGRRCADVNQALMELGALICTPKNPNCPSCPLNHNCTARKQGRELEVPLAKVRPRMERHRVAAFVLRWGDRIWLSRRAEGLVNGGFWELPTLDLDASGPISMARRKAGAFARQRGGKAVALGVVRHSIMNRRIELLAFECATRGGSTPAPLRHGRWFSAEEIARLPLTSAHGKVLALARSGAEVRPGKTRCRRP